MVFNKYVVISAFCLSGFIYGSATEEVRLVFADRPEGRLELSDCFTRESTLVPGPQRFYEPVVVGKVFELSIKERLFSIYTSTRSTKLLRGVCGLVEGDDAELTKEAAQLISTSLSDLTMSEPFANNYGELNVTSNRHIRQIVKGDVTQLKKLLNTQCVLFLFQSTNDNPLPHLVGSCLQTLSTDTVTSVSVADKVRSVESCYDANSSVSEKLGVLAKYAATLSVSHEATILKLDKARYADFLKQEFAEGV